MAHIVVVGSGAAGLTAALEAGKRHRVTLVTKSALGEGNSRYAQGGIAAATTADDSIALHLADTLTAGAGWSDEDAARILVGEGPDRVHELIALGMPFDRDGDAIARAQEAAHSRPRVLHAGGDATGRALVDTLVRALRRSPVHVIEHAFLAELTVESGAVTGVDLIVEGQPRHVAADAVVIATGGAGQLYAHTTNPLGATGDGIAAALRAGAELADMEFVQFHPTALAVPGTPLISEAVRGEGATLIDDDGERFMLAVHPDAELAPRDIVARGIAQRQLQQGGRPVRLDATGIGRETLEHRFPDLTRLCLRHGLDWALEPVPVTPAAHYWMGGIAVDDDGRTSIRGLFAVGEAACTGAHGANRLASNSLLEALVFAHRAARAIGQPWRALESCARRSPRPQAPAADAAPVSREALQQLMWRYAGLMRDGDGLAIAESQLARWRGTHATTHEHETANLLELARVVVAAAAARAASLGAHHRTDDTAAVAAPTDSREAVPA